MAVACVNCDQDAVFLVDDPGANPLDYCRAHLPGHLVKRANDGHFLDSQSTKAKTTRTKWNARGGNPPGNPGQGQGGGKGKP